MSLLYTSTIDNRLLAISNDTTIAQRDTVALICVGDSTEREVSITWTYQGQALENSRLVTITEGTLPGGRLFPMSLLQLCSVSIAQSGLYTCTVSNGLVSVQGTTELTITGNH